LARAHAVAGNKEECKKFKDLGQRATDAIKGKEDKEICQGELDKLSC
jgi:hypothetical protein